MICIFIAAPMGAFAKGSASLSVSAASACLIDAESGRLLYGKSPDRQMPMASTTKIMTAALAIELAPSLDTVVTIPHCAVGVEGSSAYLREGERMSVESLLYCLLLSSANDAALALAASLCGGVDEFVSEMNKKAQSIGLSGTHFTNPHGLHEDGHYTTARDLARLLAYAVKNEDFLRISGSYRAVIPRESGNSYIVNHNRLLRTCESVIAGKTGYTRASGRCLATCAEREGVRLIAVTLNAPNDWSDHARLYDFGFSAYERVELGGISMDIPVVSGVESTLAAHAEPISVTLPRERGDIDVVIEAPRFIFAPISAGDCIGRVRYVLNGTTVATSPLIAEGDIACEEATHGFFSWLRDLLKGLIERINR